MVDSPSEIRTALVLGAGLGTRLRPLTARRPKPLIPVGQRPLIAHAFDRLVAQGCRRLVVNTHWCALRYAEFFPEPEYHGAGLFFREETPKILETAGALWHARDLLESGPFLVYNGDVWSDLPLAPALAAHRAAGNEVTLVLRSAGGPLQVAFSAENGRVLDIGGRVDAAADPRFLFTGIYIVEPEFIARIPPATKISVIPIFCEMIRAKANLGGVVIDAGRWFDLGTRQEYFAIHRLLMAEGSLPDALAPSAEIHPSAQVSGSSVIGAGVKIGADARVHDSLLWAGCEVAAGTQLQQCIVTDGQRISGVHTEVDF